METYVWIDPIAGVDVDPTAGPNTDGTDPSLGGLPYKSLAYALTQAQLQGIRSPTFRYVAQVCTDPVPVVIDGKTMPQCQIWTEQALLATVTVTSFVQGGGNVQGQLTITGSLGSINYNGCTLKGMSGGNNGRWFVIDSNTSNTITVCDSFNSTTAPGDTFHIYGPQVQLTGGLSLVNGASANAQCVELTGAVPLSVSGSMFTLQWSYLQAMSRAFELDSGAVLDLAQSYVSSSGACIGFNAAGSALPNLLNMGASKLEATGPVTDGLLLANTNVNLSGVLAQSHGSPANTGLALSQNGIAQAGASGGTVNPVLRSWNLGSQLTSGAKVIGSGGVNYVGCATNEDADGSSYYL